MTLGHGQRCGHGLWEQGVGRLEEGNGGKLGTTVIEYTRIFFKKAAKWRGMLRVCGGLRSKGWKTRKWHIEHRELFPLRTKGGF